MKKTITPFQWAVYQAYLKNDSTLRATARELNRTPEQIRQIVAKTERRLKAGAVPPTVVVSAVKEQA